MNNGLFWFIFLIFMTHDVCPRQYVRDICQFDLTCPIRGVGPKVVRKLLLEENLKIRGRKDSKVRKLVLPSYWPFQPISEECCCHYFLTLSCFFFSRYAAGGSGPTFLRCSSNDQSPEERGAAEGRSASSGPRQNVLRRIERWL